MKLKIEEEEKEIKGLGSLLLEINLGYTALSKDKSEWLPVFSFPHPTLLRGDLARALPNSPNNQVSEW